MTQLPTKFSATAHFLNRDLGYLAFNRRVLELAADRRIPLLERLNYIFICSANLDEFFEIKVANLKQRLKVGKPFVGFERYSVTQLLSLISSQVHEITTKQQSLLQQLIPQLAAENIRFLDEKHWSRTQRIWCVEYFKTQVVPLLSPISLDQAHPFPRLINKGLNFICVLQGRDAFKRYGDLAIVHVPRCLRRLIRFPVNIGKEGHNFVYLSSLIQAFVGQLFPGIKVLGCYPFRLTRNSDIETEEENIEDLAKVVSTELFSRRYGMVVRLEISNRCPAEIIEYLLKKHNLTEQDLYLTEVQVNLARYRNLVREINRPDLKFEEFNPVIPKEFRNKTDMFSEIRKNDILLHHPYESFTCILDLLRQAAQDPSVLAIRITLYRAGPNSLIVRALADAARAGKEVTVVIELRARFDEADNLTLANRLHDAGALVMYGVVGYKTHSKMMLIVRRELNQLKSYVHLATGNYHADTARSYTDYGLLTYNQTLAKDVQKLFQLLTGMGKHAKFNKIVVSPFNLFDQLKAWIAREMRHARAGKPAYIAAKLNALTDPKIIQQLYLASCAGVKIDLIVRGPCCLKPGVRGISENITVRSILGRFLEHSRIYYFHNNGQQQVHLASADWMERNLYKRVEVCFPIENKALKRRIIEQGIILYLRDNSHSWLLQSNGTYIRSSRGNQSLVDAQKILLQELGK